MAGLLAIVAFIISFFLNVFSVAHGWFNWQALMVLGLVFLAVHLYRDWWPDGWRRVP